MTALENSLTAAMEFSLCWQCGEAAHRDVYFAPRVEIMHDIFPVELRKKLGTARVNDRLACLCRPGVLAGKYSPDKVIDLDPAQFPSVRAAGRKIAPRLGRFYPAGLLKHIAGLDPDPLTPFRVISLDDGGIRIDLNHPLSLYEVEIEILIKEILESPEENGHRHTDWLKEAAHDGPGMQARFRGVKTNFENPGRFSRYDEENDAIFYANPRFTGHIDRQASSMLREIYCGHLNRNDKVLDLMCSVESHLPDDFGLAVTGLGMNRGEMLGNPILGNVLVHDLNAFPVLPFNDRSFDAVLCSLSIEYLTRPRQIISEISRVLVKGGRLLISFSNRWFPPKVTRLWQEIHEFERLGLVLDYFLENGGFSGLHTVTVRNWPRPADDKHATGIACSDPLFIAAASKKCR